MAINIKRLHDDDDLLAAMTAMGIPQDRIQRWTDPTMDMQVLYGIGAPLEGGLELRILCAFSVYDDRNGDDARPIVSRSVDSLSTIDELVTSLDGGMMDSAECDSAWRDVMQTLMDRGLRDVLAVEFQQLQREDTTHDGN